MSYQLRKSEYGVERITDSVFDVLFLQKLSFMEIITMRKWQFLFFLLPLVLSMNVPKPKRILFFGDSITELLIQKELVRQGRSGDYELLGAGIGGNKIYDLYLRMDEDVLVKKPDVVFVYVGINDVWHKTLLGTGTDKDKFEKFYRALIRRLQANSIQVVICTPTVIGEKINGSNPQDTDLDAYSAVIRRLANEEKCTLVDLRAAFMDYLKLQNTTNKESGLLTYDRVHLTDQGNQLVAQQFLKSILSGSLH